MSVETYCVLSQAECNITEHFYSLFAGSHLKVYEREKMHIFASSFTHCLGEKEFIVWLTDECYVDEARSGNFPRQGLRPAQFFPAVLLIARNLVWRTRSAVLEGWSCSFGIVL